VTDATSRTLNPQRSTLNPPWLALDVGGANLKAADGLGFGQSHYFPLWREPQNLTHALRELLSASPPAERLAVTMTGELADCFATKAEGVEAILSAVVSAAAGLDVQVYLTDGRWATVDQAREQPLRAAASNWHALARFACRYLSGGSGLLIDIGSTTCDIIPLVGGMPAATGKADTERLLHGELVYTGVERSPVCAVVAAVPYQGRQCPTAHELFATTWDAYLTLGDLPEEPESTHTADGRPAAKAAARDRLARSICADRTIFSEQDAIAAATAVARAQAAKIAIAAQGVVRRMPSPPEKIIIAGQGEFLARQVLAKATWAAPIVSLGDELGPVLSRCATAHALAVLAREDFAP
jgi:probable H4MPT-linked C1 transfer pathway protein